jgi:hypothetical protein
MSWVITGSEKTPVEALEYLRLVELADGQALESGVRDAVIAFVAGCKTDGIWSAIKASCILAGARTLGGALVPLAGTAPTNVSGNFVSGDYNRKTGLIGNGSTKYLSSNRNNNADPQDSSHNAVYVHTAGTATAAYMGASAATNSVGDNNIGRAGAIFVRNRNGGVSGNVGTTTATGLIGTSRSSSASFIARVSGSNTLVIAVSQSPFNGNVSIFASGALGFPTNARLAFYSIGESLDLALLDTRVTALINAFDAAI